MEPMRGVAKTRAGFGLAGQRSFGRGGSSGERETERRRRFGFSNFFYPIFLRKILNFLVVFLEVVGMHTRYIRVSHTYAARE